MAIPAYQGVASERRAAQFGAANWAGRSARGPPGAGVPGWSAGGRATRSRESRLQPRLGFVPFVPTMTCRVGKEGSVPSCRDEEERSQTRGTRPRRSSRAPSWMGGRVVSVASERRSQKMRVCRSLAGFETTQTSLAMTRRCHAGPPESQSHSINERPPVEEALGKSYNVVRRESTPTGVHRGCALRSNIHSPLRHPERAVRKCEQAARGPPLA